MTGYDSPEASSPGALATAVVERTSDAVLVVDEACLVVFANQAAAELFAVPLDDLIGTDYRGFVPPAARRDHRLWHETFMANAFASAASTRPTASSRRMGPAPCVRAQRGDGRVIDIDVALTPLDDRRVAVVARRAAATRRMVDRLLATNHLLTTALSGAADDELADQALDLVIETMQSDRGGLLRVDADGVERVSIRPDPADDRHHTSVLAERLSAHHDASGGSGIDNPPLGDHELIGAVPDRGGVRRLAVWRDTDDVAFDDLDAELLRTLGFAIAVAFELVSERLAGERQRTAVDHERIARELHDRVIQHLFAVAMRLDAGVPAAGDAAAADVAARRMSEAVAELDDAIIEIRSAIFDLRRPTIAASGLRSAVVHEIGRASSALGFSPRVQFSGVLDAAASPELTETASTVVRELLSNCARHAGATAIDVAVTNADAALTIVVRDNGCGFDPDRTTWGDGLANAAARAGDIGGTVHIVHPDEGGTEVTWSVPLTGRRQ